MRRTKPLPPHLHSGAFDRAALADADVAASRIRRGDTTNPYHGVHTIEAAEDVRGRCEEYAVRLRPGQLFSHVTAAQLHGLPLPAALDLRTALDVAAVHPAGPPQTRKVIGHRLRRPPDITHIDGLPVCSAEETWCQLSATLDLVDLVVVADHLLHRASMAAEAAGDDAAAAATATRERLRAAVNAPGRWRRAVLNQAIRLARAGSASPGESRARMVLVLAGVPEPELNATVVEQGEWLGRPDLLWRRERVMIEYEGDQHRTDRKQWRRDIDRYDAFHAAGWTVIRITADNLEPARRAELIARVQSALGLIS